MLTITILYGQVRNDSLRSVLTKKLETIYDNDQKYRQTSDWKMVMKMDSINQIEVIEILDKYGWLSEDYIGKKASAAIFLVIQHAELPIQEKYLPIMRDAVKNGAARIKDLALLEDRVLMRQGKRQIYGSQVVKDSKGNWIVHPIEDPTNVDKRRLEIGLLPIADYLIRMGITWDLEEHLKAQNKK
jgi:hypothetical protein